MGQYGSLDELYAAAALEDEERKRRNPPSSTNNKRPAVTTPDRGSGGGGHHWGNVGNTQQDRANRSFWQRVSDPEHLRRASWTPLDAAQVVIGGVRDGVQGFMDAVDDLAEVADAFVYERTGVGTYMVAGKAADNGVFQFVDFKTYQKRIGSDGFGDLPEVATPDKYGATIARDVVEFGVNFVPAMRATRALTALGTTARVSPAVAAGLRGTQATVAGAYAAFVDHAPMEGNLVNIAKDLGIQLPTILEALEVDETDDALIARLKNGAVDFVAGPIFDGALAGLVGAIKGVKALRSIDKDLDDILGVPEEFMRPAPSTLQPAKSTAASTPSPASVVDDPSVPTSPKDAEPIGPHEERVAGDFTSQPQRVRANIKKLSDADKKKLADDLMSGNPARAVAAEERLGLHPDRVDVTKALLKDETGDAVVDVIVKTADAIQDLSDAYGSSRRGWNEAQTLGNLLGVHKNRVVEVFQAKTKNLDAFAMVARRTVANSSVDLMRMAEKAKNYAGDPDSKEWMEFMTALDTHAVLHATLKGATSNMGRGLASLRATVNASASTKARLKALAGKAEVGPVDEALSLYQKMMAQTTTAGRRALVNRVLKTKGDYRKLGKIADAGTGPNAFQRAAREYLVNSLWSVGTMKATVIGTVLHGSARTASRAVMHGHGLFFAGKRGQAYAIERAADVAYTSTMIRSLGMGFGRTLHLLADTALHEGKLIAGPLGGGKAVQRVHDALNDSLGPFKPSTARPDFERQTAFAIKPETIDALMASADQLPAVMRLGYRGLLGVLGSSVNALGATGRGVRALTIEAADELFGSVSTHAHRAAYASRQAMTEGYAKGLKGKELEDWVTTRSKTYFDNESEDLLQQIEARVAAGADPESPEVVEMAKLALARMDIEDQTSSTVSQLLLQDPLQTGVARGVSEGLRNVDRFFGDMGLLFPIIHTPLRGLEVALKDFTPLGLMAKDMRDRLTGGGPDSSIVMAQMALGSTLIGWAAMKAMDVELVGYDGGPKSSNRLVRPQYSIKIGDKWHEYNRYDPMTLHLGLSADMVEIMRGVDLEGAEEPDPSIVRAASAMALAFTRNVLSRNFMRTITNYGTILSDPEGGQAEARLKELLVSTGTRAVPASGMGKWYQGEDLDATKEAVTLWEKALRGSGWFQSSLPDRVDPLLGRPIKYDRELGVATKEVTDDRLVNEMAAIAFNMPAQAKTLKGVTLTSDQLSRAAVIRAQVALDNRGMTMTENLEELIDSYEWPRMNQGAREREVRKIRDSFNRLVPDILAAEDPEFAFQLAREAERKVLTQDLGLEGAALWSALEDFDKSERRMRGLPAKEQGKFDAIFNP